MHEHGAAELLIALANNEIAIELQTPAFNILGFEYAPTSDAELALLADSIATLETGAFLQINADAECILVSADVHADVADADQTADAQDETTHSDIDATYRLDCAQPENIAELDVSGLFEAFPNFEDIDVQWISDTTQSATALTPDNQIVLFK